MNFRTFCFIRPHRGRTCTGPAFPLERRKATAYTSLIPVRRLDRVVKYVRDKTKTAKPTSLEEAVDYALNRDKTESVCFETGLSCLCETAFTDMKANAHRWHKTGGVQGYHLVQSFAAGEVTPELAHQIGVELAD